MTDLHNVSDASRNTEQAGLPPNVLGSPEDVQNDPNLTNQEKRAVLASWASDANAVPHLPTLRQLPDGSIVRLSDILHALKALDGRGSAVQNPDSSHAMLRRWPYNRRGWILRNWTRRRRGPDDDDPPPCPAYAATRPRSGGGAAFAYPEPVPA